MKETPKIEAPFALGAQIEARANHPEVASWPCLKKDDVVWTFRDFREESVRMAHFLRRRLGAIDDAHPGHVAMVLENHLGLMSLYGGCGYAGLTLFGVNTGLRGDTLAGVLNQSRARVVVVDQRLQEHVDRIRDQLEHVAPENLLVLRTEGRGELVGADLTEQVAREIGPAGKSLDAPAIDVSPETPLMVIYTSGTTGLPKGIMNNHLKLLFIGMAVSANLQLGPDDVGYACMPLFHSNAMFLGFQPAFNVCGSLALRERFSASRFVPDLLHYGVTYWNYVGEPVHYVLGALEKEYGTVARIRAEVTNHPRNQLSYALGNGAAATDI